MSAKRTNHSRLDAWLEAWPRRLAERDEAFITRLAAEVAALDQLGYDDREKLLALGGRLYVIQWRHCPRWMEWVGALPSPLKWRDGEVYKQPKHPAMKVLIHADALFLRYPGCEPAGTRRDGQVILVVHDWRARTLPELIEELPGGQSAERALAEFARAHGLRLSGLVPVLRNKGGIV